MRRPGRRNAPEKLSAEAAPVFAGGNRLVDQPRREQQQDEQVDEVEEIRHGESVPVSYELSLGNPLGAPTGGEGERCPACMLRTSRVTPGTDEREPLPCASNVLPGGIARVHAFRLQKAPQFFLGK